jgi:plastocyanin
MKGLIFVAILVACGGGQVAETTAATSSPPPATSLTTAGSSTTAGTVATTTLSSTADVDYGYDTTASTSTAPTASSTTTTIVATTFAPTTVASASQTTTVGLENFAIVPSTVTIRVGDTVRWVVNSGGHTTTSGAGAADGLWDEAVSADGYARVFEQVGSFEYFCRFHPTDMRGKVVVEP